MKPILVITYWSFKDALIQTYTLPYLKIMAKVSSRKIYLVCLEQPQHAILKSQQLELENEYKKQNIHLVFLQYNRFGLKQALLWISYIFKLLYIILKNKVEYIHAWCTPAGSIGYILSIVSRRKLIIDSYEPHAESMVENGSWAKDSIAYRILFYLERKQSEKASLFIAAASGMKQYAKHTYSVSIADNAFFIKPACTELEKFKSDIENESLCEELNLKDKIVCVYAGKLGGIYLDNEVFDFIKECYNYWGENFRFLMLTNATIEEVLSHIKRVNIPQEIIIQKFLPHAAIPSYLSLGDFSLNPVKPVPSKRYCTSIKDGEYWAMGLPVVITKNISDDSDIISENNIGYVLQELSKQEYIKAIDKINELLKEDKSILQNRIRVIAEKYRSFDIAEKVYTTIYAN